MKIHEYQAKSLFGRYGIPVPRGKVIASPGDIGDLPPKLKAGPVVLKAQVHAGGRGKAGGVRIAKDPVEARRIAAGLLHTRLVTPQTGKEGKPVGCLLVEEVLEVVREIYLGITIDRERECVLFIAGGEGGTDIERTALESPSKLIREAIDPSVGLRSFQVNRIVYGLGIDLQLVRSMTDVTGSLYRIFVDLDCSLAEINPLVVTRGGKLVALDGKLNFDDNALFRHAEILSFRDTTQEDPFEAEASRYSLNYVKLHGNVGCMVNGAGLAMATMDLIKHVGAEPANFLDVGGGATAETVSRGLKILLEDLDVRVIFINIFGGILRCDTLAAGVVEAARQLRIKVPVVVRLEGTNVEAGREMLARSGLEFVVASGFADAAGKIAAALKMVNVGQGGS